MEGGSEERFGWHPTYRGRTAAEVRAEVARELGSDQRAYALAMQGAEEHEGQVLASVIALEKRWGPYDMGWFEADAGELAGRVVAFELERDRRQELIPYAAYRAEQTPAPATAGGGTDRPWWAFWRR